MAIAASELVLYKSLTITDTSTNGGRRSNDAIVSGAVNNLFALVLPEDRVAGDRQVRKIFPSVDNDDDLTLYQGRLYIDAPTPGDDWCTMFIGTQRDTMADHGTVSKRYGCALLASNATAGASTLIVNVEDATIAGMYTDGDTICITDRTIPTRSASGNREFHTISGTPVVVGAQVTITIAGTLANSYTTANSARVASVIELGDITAGADNWVETGAGTYDETTYPVLPDNLGTIEQTWNLTFSDATTYTVTGDTVGSVGSGTVGSNFAPTNTAKSKPYFTLRSAGFGGTWATGNTIVFQTHPAAGAVYLDWVIPAGAEAIDNNRFTVVFTGYRA